MMTNHQKKQYLDVRWLPPPEPFENIMRALGTLPADVALQVNIHREPFPLYDVLRDSGYAWQTTALANGDFVILITRISDTSRNSLLRDEAQGAAQ